MTIRNDCCNQIVENLGGSAQRHPGFFITTYAMQPIRYSRWEPLSGM